MASKRWLGFLNLSHEAVAPYSPHVRVVLHDSSGAVDLPGAVENDAISSFLALARKLGIPSNLPLIDLSVPGRGLIEAPRLNYLKQLKNIDLNLFPFPIAFQVDALLRNGLVNPPQMGALIERLKDLYQAHSNNGFLDYLLRQYNVSLRKDPTHRADPLLLFDSLSRKFKLSPRTQAAKGMFECYHVTCTPSRMILEGPYPTGFNRIIRRYHEMDSSLSVSNHFIRVEFRSDDGDWLKSGIEVDASHLLEQMVGGAMKGGVQIAGRPFEFVAYSGSSLKVHSTWYINPFDFTDKSTGKTTKVDAHNIRAGIVPDIEENEKLFKTPSKYAARVALAFTTSESDPSLRLHRYEWDGSLPDRYPYPPTIQVKLREAKSRGDSNLDEFEAGTEPKRTKTVKLAPFTDGIGVISAAYAERIWQVTRRQRRPHIDPSFRASAVGHHSSPCAI